MTLFAQNTAPRDLEEVERRDWELWSIALILLTACQGRRKTRPEGRRGNRLYAPERN